MRHPGRWDRFRSRFLPNLVAWPVVALSLIAGVAPACAQLSTLDPAEPPGPLMREALAAPYGRALLAELGQSISTSADPACLQAKSLTPPQLNERAGALIETWGIRALEQIAAAFDAKAHEARLTERVGPNAVAELKRLREQPDVKRYRAIERNWRLARIADFIFEQFDRYALVARLNLRPVSPLATGNEALLRQNPAESLEDALDAFREKNKSAALERY